MADRLDELLVEDALHGLPAWRGDANGIKRDVYVAGPAAEDLLARVDATAAAMDHTPQIIRDDQSVSIVLSTDEVGGVTVTDIAMASVIEDHVAAATGQPAQHGHHEVMAEAVEVPPQVTDHEEAAGDRLEPLIGQPSGGAGGPATMLPNEEPGAPEPGPAPEQEVDERL